MSGADVGLAVSAEPLLVAVVGLLVLVIVGLIAMAIVLRRRSHAAVAAMAAAALPHARAVQAAPPSPPPRPRARAMRGGGGAGLAMATSTSTAMVCPTCRTEYHGLMYCTRDARRLVPPEEMLGGGVRTPGRSAGLVCMACRRAYEPGLRSCPHDGNELVPSQVYAATRPRRPRTSEPTGVVARICPVCATKYDLNARFCGHDAGELVVIN
jgi:uncharacterized protein YbaR (Trm112 family)